MLKNLFWKKKTDNRKADSLAFYKNFIPQGGLVFDIGANIGNRTEIFLALGAKVVAVEPQPSCNKILKGKFGDKISIENVGLSSQTGSMEFYIADETTISTFSKDFISKTGVERFKRNKWDKSITVPVETFDNLIIKYGVPDFCKIDVEGYEFEVLKGLSQKLPCMSFEYCVPEMNDNLVNCIHYLAGLGPETLFNYSEGESMKLNLLEWLNYKEFLSVTEKNDFQKTLFGDIYTKMKN